MDNPYVWFKLLADWIENHPLPGIPFADFAASERCYNPPAEHLEICFNIHGEYDDLQIGDMKVNFPSNHVSLHNVHFGNYSSKVQAPRAWCLFLDVAEVTEFSRMRKAPFFVSMPVVNPQRLGVAFETVATRCRIPSLVHPGYLTGTLAYDPNDTRHRSDSRRLYIKSAILELFAVLLENARGLETDGSTEGLETIRQAIEFITGKYPNPHLVLGDIAEDVHLCEDYFGLLFRRHVGTTPMQYLKTVRIQQGKLLLARTRLPIRDIARKVGFADPLYFSRVFHQETGISPRQYRRTPMDTNVRDGSSATQ